MDITKFFVSRRNDALLLGDYGSYRKQLSRQLLTLRRRLGRSTPKGRKYASKEPITAEDVARQPEFIHLLLLTCERAWAHALYMKSMHSADSSAKDITGSTRKHIISRLHRAEQTASHLVEILKSNEEIPSHSRTVWEARAYFCMLYGGLQFESRRWEGCLEAYSEAHVLYTVLGKSSVANLTDVFFELLSTTVDPSIRYAAYQLRLPRTLSITKIVVRFLKADSEFVREALAEDQSVLGEGNPSTKRGADGELKALPKTISWRERTVNLEDANIAQALAAVSDAEQKLISTYTSNIDMTQKERAAAYDEVLIPSQDAVDATKTAIDELTADGVAQDDQRMQALQLTRTAVNYALVGWRIGRHRVLCGRDDGAQLESEPVKKQRNATGNPREELSVKESNGKKVSRLRERVALYDTILQSLDSVKVLPGVAADQALLDELNAQRSYFASLRCLSIAHSHSLLNNPKNALALFARASSLLPNPSSGHLSANPTSTIKLVNQQVTPSQASRLHVLLEGFVARYRALVEIQNLTTEATKAEKSKLTGSIPMIERLDEYPRNGADLSNLVIYPPRLRPVPVKPIFLDVAWTYIDYPGRNPEENIGPNGVVSSAEESVQEKKEGRKGWFGFGR